VSRHQTRDFSDYIVKDFQRVHSVYLSVCLSVYAAGNIPPEICRLSFLTVLVLAGNNLSGERNEHYEKNKKILSIILFRGEDPYFLFSDIPSWLRLPDIPSEIGNLTSLTWLSLPKNKLSGEGHRECFALCKNCFTLNTYVDKYCKNGP
jgi:hypothetical protein